MNRIEKGKRPVRGDELKDIADYFNISTDYLLGRNTPPASLSKPQSMLLKIFDTLNSDRQNLITAILGSLEVTHSKENPNVSIIQKNSGGTNMIISHQEKILEVADIVVVMDVGEVARVGAPVDVVGNINSKVCVKLQGGKNE